MQHLTGVVDARLRDVVAGLDGAAVIVSVPIPSWRSEVTVDAVDVVAVQRLLPALLAQWRALTFDGDGLLNRPLGVRHAGVRVDSGTHPSVGTTYRAIEPVPPGSDEPDPDDPSWAPAVDIGDLRLRPTPLVATLAEDSSRAVRILFSTERDATGEVTLTDPARAAAITATREWDFSESIGGARPAGVSSGALYPCAPSSKSAS